MERTGTDPLRFPEDEKDEGFVNIGDHLVMSDFLLKLTMDAVGGKFATGNPFGTSSISKGAKIFGVFIREKGRGNIRWNLFQGKKSGS